ncbi:MAG: ATP-binding protein [Sphingobium sp.]|nr:ATP-binding protein [Sphingobium sp.]
MARYSLRPLLGSLAANTLVPVALALVLLLASLVLGLQTERGRLAERLRASHVQAEIIARSIAAPLAFDDKATIEDYLTALKANGNVLAAGAYSPDGALKAGFARPGAGLPKRIQSEASGREKGDIVWLVPVVQNGTRLGLVYLRYSTETWSRRASRYLGVTLLLITAALLIASLGIAYSSLSRAHRALREQSEQRERAEEALRQSQKMEAMGQLTGGVAHDFNNLLMVASGGLDLLDRTSDPERRERLKASIRQAIDRGAKLTQQLLTFARKSPLKPEVIDVERTVRGLRDLLDRSLRENVVIEMRFASDLCPVEVDPSQFEVAILNIALNARDAMPEGGTIRIEAEQLPASEMEPAQLRVAISDEGVGVTPENLAKVFEPFFTTKGVGQGTGLGLSQVYGFARSSGGDVRFDSEFGKGSTVAILLPCSAKPLPGSALLSDTVQTARRRCRVLLVEDDDHVAELVGEMLSELDYNFVRAHSGTAALDQLARDQDFDMVFSDMVMPGAIGGLELTREIGRRWPDLKILLTSGYSEAAASALAEGRDILPKPYTIQALGAMFDEVLSAKGNPASR